MSNSNKLKEICSKSIEDQIIEFKKVQEEYKKVIDEINFLEAKRNNIFSLMIRVEKIVRKNLMKIRTESST